MERAGQVLAAPAIQIIWQVTPVIPVMNMHLIKSNASTGKKEYPAFRTARAAIQQDAKKKVERGIGMTTSKSCSMLTVKAEKI